MGVKVRKPKGRKSWCVVIDHQGHRKTKAVGSREAAERVKREIEARLATGGVRALQPEPDGPPTLSQYAQAWMKNIEYERKPSTAAFYSQYLRLYVLPKFGARRLDGIKRDEVKGFIGDLRARNLSKNTIRLALTTLRTVLNAAIEDSLLEQNPAQRLGRFVKSEKSKREATSLTPHEAGQLLAAAKERLPFSHYALLLMALRAGLRQGELAGLQWSDLHFGDGFGSSERYLLVQRGYDRRWSRSMLTPKSHKSRRVDMSRDLRQTLLTLRQAAAEKLHGSASLDNDLVFPSEAGTPIEMNNFYARVFQPLLKQAGLRKIRFHDLRHTFGSLLIQTGASLAYVRDQMGHSSIQITVDVYGHLVPGANISYVDRLDLQGFPPQSATPAQRSISASNRPDWEVLENVWLGGRDSNPDTQIQSLQSYH
jgi:integrase